MGIGNREVRGNTENIYKEGVRLRKNTVAVYTRTQNDTKHEKKGELK